jgi:hypothetical protein
MPARTRRYTPLARDRVRWPSLVLSSLICAWRAYSNSRMVYRSSFQTRTGDVDCGVDRKPIHVGADYGCKLPNSTCIERGLSDFDPFTHAAPVCLPTLLALPHIRPSPPSIAVVLLTYPTCHVILSSYAARTPPQYPPISTLRFSDISLHDLPSLNLHFAISSYPTVPYLPFLHSVGRLCKSVPSPTSFVAITFFPFFSGPAALGAFWPWSGGAPCTVPGSSVCVVNSMMKVCQRRSEELSTP